MRRLSSSAWYLLVRRGNLVVMVDASADHEMDDDAEHMADVVVNRGPSASECPSNV
jgi:hypothetical protein